MRCGDTADFGQQVGRSAINDIVDLKQSRRSTATAVVGLPTNKRQVGLPRGGIIDPDGSTGQPPMIRSDVFQKRMRQTWRKCHEYPAESSESTAL
jgi:hypothetical protein